MHAEQYHLEGSVFICLNADYENVPGINIPGYLFLEILVRCSFLCNFNLCTVFCTIAQTAPSCIDESSSSTKVANLSLTAKLVTSDSISMLGHIITTQTTTRQCWFYTQSWILMLYMLHKHHMDWAGWMAWWSPHIKQLELNNKELLQDNASRQCIQTVQNYWT